MQLEKPEPTSCPSPASPARRPDIDLVRVCLTWGILAFHTTMAYAWGGAFGLVWVPKLGDTASFMAIAFTEFMESWNMPMFFFLSGTSAYFSLFKRSGQKFALERIHRLLVPYLFMFQFQCSYVITYFSPDCKPLSKANTTNLEATLSRWSGCIMMKDTMAMENTTFISYLAKQYIPYIPYIPHPGQAWFLFPLFFYSLAFTHLFTLWHPAHCASTPSTITWLTKLLCSTNRVGLIPGVIMGMISSAVFGLNNEIFSLISPSPMYFGYIPNINYILIFLLGYLLAAIDDINKVMDKKWWIFLIPGLVFTLANALMSTVTLLYEIPNSTLFLIGRGFFHGSGQWLLILGICSLARTIITRPRAWLSTLSTISLPFYLLHQQVLVIIMALTLWVPYLGSLPSNLILATLATTALAYLVTKITALKYFFGLPTTSDSCLPGNICSGFLPLLCISALAVLSMVFPYFVQYFS